LEVELVYDLEKLPVISGFDASNLSSHFRNEFYNLLFQGHVLAVGIEANKQHVATVAHHDIVVSVLFVFPIVPTVCILVGLDSEQGAVDDSPMVDASQHRTITTAIQLLVVDKAFKILVDRFLHSELFRLVVADLALGMGWELMLVACRAVAIVVTIPHPRDGLVDTFRASEAATVLAAQALALSTFGATRLDTELFFSSVTFATP
jgi:hypothetical protein